MTNLQKDFIKNSKPLGDRLSKWNQPGCLMNENESTNWKFMDDLELGEHVDMAYADNSNVYAMAKRRGIRVAVRKHYTGDARIIRIA